MWKGAGVQPKKQKQGYRQEILCQLPELYQCKEKYNKQAVT